MTDAAIPCDRSKGGSSTSRNQDTLEIAPVAGRIGAEIRGVRLADGLGDATATAIRAALVRYKAIFLRDQHDLTDAGQEAFTERLGEPVVHPTVRPAAGSRFLLDINSDKGPAAGSWHTDASFVPAPPAASILRALEIPEVGGDTMFANTATAYDGLPDPLRAFADTLRAVHSNVYDESELFKDREAIAANRAVFAPVVFETEHPLVRVHPESGERNLLVGHFMTQLVGFTATETHRLRMILQDHITKPENVVRWRWRKGDIVIWDNRATQHRAVADFGDARRHLRRSTIKGIPAIGVDGRESRQLGQEPSAKRAA